MPDATCSVTECDRAPRTRGWCNMHYQRWRRHGDPVVIERIFITSFDGLCMMEGCSRPTVGRGLCRKHYQRQWKHGDASVNLRPELAQTGESRFWAKVDKNGSISTYAPQLGACWIWKASLDTAGYGHFGMRRRLVLAHRHSYELMHGPIPDGLELDHLCRVRSCVNPEHLEPVTSIVNVHRGADARIAQRGGTCANGHEMTAANTYRKKDGRPVCRKCVRANQRRYRQRKKEGTSVT